MNKFKFPGKETRLVRCGSTIYKLTIQSQGGHAEFSVGNLSCTEEILQRQIKNGVQVAVMMSRHSKMKSFRSDHLIFSPERVPWTGSSEMQFSQHRQMLSVHPYMIIIKISPLKQSQTETNVEKEKATKRTFPQILEQDGSGDNVFHSPPKRQRDILSSPSILKLIQKEALSSRQRRKLSFKTQQKAKKDFEDIRKHFSDNVPHSKKGGDVKNTRLQEEANDLHRNPEEQKDRHNEERIHSQLRRSPRLLHSDKAPNEPVAGKTAHSTPVPVIQQARTLPYNAIQRPDRHLIEQQLLDEQIRIQRLATPATEDFTKRVTRSHTSGQTRRSSRTPKTDNKAQGGVISFLMTPFKRFLRR